MTLDEIFDSMTDAAADAGHEYLVIDPDSRSIIVPEAEKIFGVVSDENAVRKHFLAPRYVGDNLDLAGMFLTVYFRNANGEEDGYMVNDVQVVQGAAEYVTFSWELWPKVTAYMGPVQFAVCADLPNTPNKRRPDWNTTLAEGEVLEGLHPDQGDVEDGTSDVVAQLREMVTAQTAAVEATGAAQVATVKAQGTDTTQEAVAAIQAQGEATVASIPADYTDLAATVDRLTRDRAAAIVCQAEGTAIQVQDASNDPLQGLRIFGRSTQDGTPTPEAPVEIVSLPAPVVTVTDGTEDNVQTLTIITPGRLPGIPVASGGNYTDENGQQWIADEVDLARGVYIQRIIKKTIVDFSASSNHLQFGGFTEGNIWLNANVLYATGLCDRFGYAVNGAYERFAALGSGAVYFVVSGDLTQEEWRSKMTELAPTIMLALATPAETPLTDVELQAYLALHSSKPTTTVLNDAGAHMALEYAADPKTYIDNKLAALVAANG